MTVPFLFLSEDFDLDQRQKGTFLWEEAPQMGQSWENNGKAWAGVCPAGTLPCLDLNTGILGAAA